MIKEDSYEDVLSTRYTARIAKKQLGILKNEKEISDQTVDEKIKLVEGELIGLGLANELRRVQTELTSQQIEKITTDIAQAWKKLSIDEQNMIINAANSEVAKMNAQTNIRDYYERVRKYKNNIHKHKRIRV